MSVYWVSCPKFTVKVIVKNGKISGGADFIKKFIGQPLSNLAKWANKFGQTDVKELK